VTIGDKNFTEQFLLGQLYDQALTAQGYQVVLNPNIGPTQVTYQALTSGRLSMYPEYLDVWNTSVAGNTRSFRTDAGAYRAAQRWALAHGLRLLRPTPFSDTDTLAVTRAYGERHRLSTIGDLRKVAAGMTLGAPMQFQQASGGLPALEQAYGFTPAAVKTLDIGEQYQSLAQGTVQAAYITTTDGQLAGRSLRMLTDPRNVLGYGNAVPIVPLKVLAAEGPAFARTINRVTKLLTLKVMRRLNAEVDVAGRDPKVVAQAFLERHGLVPRSAASS
jgi:osmoprotectant transport system substrate-binding protein